MLQRAILEHKITVLQGSEASLLGSRSSFFLGVAVCCEAANMAVQAVKSFWDSIEQAPHEEGEGRKRHFQRLLGLLQELKPSAADVEAVKQLLPSLGFTGDEGEAILSVLSRAVVVEKPKRREQQDYSRLHAFLSRQHWHELMNRKTCRDRAEYLCEFSHDSLGLWLPTEQTLGTMAIVCTLLEGGPPPTSFHLHSNLAIVRSTWKGCAKRYHKKKAGSREEPLLPALPVAFDGLPEELQEAYGVLRPASVGEWPFTEAAFNTCTMKGPLRSNHSAVSSSSSSRMASAQVSTPNDVLIARAVSAAVLALRVPEPEPIPNLRLLGRAAGPAQALQLPPPAEEVPRAAPASQRH